jgi:hypothetical protein
VAYVEGRLVPAKGSMSAFDGCNCDKAAEAPMFKLRSLFDESPFILSVVGEHFCSEWSFTGAPRRNVGILFGHLCHATTEQDNAPPNALTTAH